MARGTAQAASRRDSEPRRGRAGEPTESSRSPGPDDRLDDDAWLEPWGSCGAISGHEVSVFLTESGQRSPNRIRSGAQARCPVNVQFELD